MYLKDSNSEMSRKLFVFEWILVGVLKVKDTQQNYPITIQ